MTDRLMNIIYMHRFILFYFYNFFQSNFKDEKSVENVITNCNFYTFCHFFFNSSSHRLQLLLIFWIIFFFIQQCIWLWKWRDKNSKRGNKKEGIGNGKGQNFSVLFCLKQGFFNSNFSFLNCNSKSFLVSYLLCE